MVKKVGQRHWLDRVRDSFKKPGTETYVRQLVQRLWSDNSDRDMGKKGLRQC